MFDRLFSDVKKKIARKRRGKRERIQDEQFKKLITYSSRGQIFEQTT